MKTILRPYVEQWDGPARQARRAGAEVSRAVGSLTDRSTFGPNPIARRFGAVFEVRALGEHGTRPEVAPGEQPSPAMTTGPGG